MAREGLHVFLLFVATLRIINGCYYNDCICIDESVFCEDTDTATPLFSDDELIEIVMVQITSTQSEWFYKNCEDYPRLQDIVMLEGYQCSHQFCVPCR